MARSEAGPLKSRALPLLGRFLPIFTDFHRFFGLSWETSTLNNYHPEDSRHFTLLYSTLLYFTLLYFTLLYSTLLYFTLLYFTLLCFTLLYFTLFYFTLLYLVLVRKRPDAASSPGGPPGTPGGTTYQEITRDYARIFLRDPSNNLGELLDCHFIGLIILHMLIFQVHVFFFSNSTSRGIATLKM